MRSKPIFIKAKNYKVEKNFNDSNNRIITFYLDGRTE
jgi:hypothetical protein